MTDDNTRGASRDHPRSQRPIPVAVRVEAGWDRTATKAADINRISTAVDVDLRRAGADRAVQLQQTADVSVVDASRAPQTGGDVPGLEGMGATRRPSGYPRLSHGWASRRILGWRRVMIRNCAYLAHSRDKQRERPPESETWSRDEPGRPGHHCR